MLNKSSIEVYGIPNCGTCKKAIKWLEDNNVDYQFINTKDNPPSTTMIENWVKTLSSKAMRNTSGKSYRDLGDDKKTWTDQQWIQAFAADAMLLKRPLFVKDNRAVLVGFRASETEIKDKLGVS
jgi:arsenate reductase (glutaredoxin)